MNKNAEARRTLLIVDDEPMILSAMERLFLKEGYNVLKASSPKLGLKLLEEYTVGVIISDQQMPEMTGVEFLSQVKNAYPDIVRIVMTGYSSLDIATRAINEGAIYKFIAKPWEANSLRAVIREAFQHYELIKEKEQLKKKISDANEELTRINQVLEKSLETKSQQLIKATQYDSVTDLPNRLLFSDRLNQALLQTERNENQVAVFVIGLDRFTLFNETFGHLVGDKLLSAVAERIYSTLRSPDTVARIGSDEFAIVLPNMENAQEATEAATRIQKAFEKAFMVEENESYVSFSLGISIYTSNDTDGETLLKRANTAMHYAKDKGGNTFQYFDSEMNERALQYFELEKELRHAIERKEFIVYYQAQVDIQTGNIVGAEALLRWQHPQKGVISPGVFIPILEKTGLIEPVGWWILKEVFSQSMKWRNQGLFRGQLSINLSVKQLQCDKVIEIIKQIIDETGIEPTTVPYEIEVTESLLISNVEETIEILKHLKTLGFNIAIDDFGTGYASLNYITRFPVKTLKIDLSFIRRIHQSEKDNNVIAAIISMAHSLKLLVVAEGVETEEQLNFLREHECDLIQGYLISPPVSKEAFVELLDSKLNKRL